MLRDGRAQQVVHPGEHGAGQDEPGPVLAQQRVRAGHDERGRDALVRHVPADDHQAAVGQRDEVVEVPADRARRPVERLDGPAGQSGQLLRQELLLDQLRDAQLLLDAFDLAGLGLVLAHELADPQRRCGVPGQRVQQPPIVGRVALLGPAGPEVQDADQLSGHDQGDDEHDARRPQRRDGGGAEVVERVQVDRRGGAAQVVEQRVVGGDVDRPCGVRLVGRRAGEAISVRRRASALERPNRPSVRIRSSTATGILAMSVACQVVDARTHVTWWVHRPFAMANDLVRATCPGGGGTDACSAKSEASVAVLYRRGPGAIPLRCGTVKWGFRHVVGHGRWNERFDAKIAWTISRGQVFDNGKIYAVFNGECLELFRVVVNPGAIYGTGFSPQGIVTAYETSGWPTSVAWAGGPSDIELRSDCLLYDKVRISA